MLLRTSKVTSKWVCLSWLTDMFCSATERNGSRSIKTRNRRTLKRHVCYFQMNQFDDVDDDNADGVNDDGVNDDDDDDGEERH